MTAWRCDLHHGMHSRLVAPHPSLPDRLLPSWRVEVLPAALPAELHVQALLDCAQREQDDRLALLCLVEGDPLYAHLARLETTFLVLTPTAAEHFLLQKELLHEFE